MIHIRSALIGLRGLLLALSLLLVGGGIGIAQDATPTAVPTPHPAHIHEGTCDNLDPAPLFPLNDVSVPTQTGEPQGGDFGSPIAVATSTTTIDASLADLVGDAHAINIHESETNIQTYIACGDIGGAMITGLGEPGDSQVAIGLRELNDFGYSGVAVLEAVGNQTEVRIYLARGLAGGVEGTTESPSAEAGDEATAVSVEIRDFAYSPDPVTISVGDTVTWTNHDAEPHTATTRDRDVLQTGTINEGESYSETFDTAGTYQYVCEFHPGMEGTLIVE